MRTGSTNPSNCQHTVLRRRVNYGAIVGRIASGCNNNHIGLECSFNRLS